MLCLKDKCHVKNEKEEDAHSNSQNHSTPTRSKIRYDASKSNQ